MPAFVVDKTQYGCTSAVFEVGGVPTDQSDDCYDYGFFRTLQSHRQTVNTPGFRKQRKTQPFKKRFPLLPMNNFDYLRDEIHYLRGTAHDESLPDGYYQSTFTGKAPALYAGYNVWRSGGYQPQDLIFFQQQAEAKAVADLKDQKANLVQAYAERMQTANMFASNINSIVGCVRNLRAGNYYAAVEALGQSVNVARQNRKFQVRYAKNPAEAVANSWLQLQYGWKPLLSDLYGSIELIAQAQAREIRNKVKSTLHRTQTQKTELTTSPVSGLYIVDESYTVRYIIYYTVENDELHSLSQLGILNPLYIAWELMPWSFVVDWFWPVGNYINGLDATAGLRFDSGCKTTFHRRTEKVICKGIQVSGPARYEANLEGARFMVHCKREKLSGFPTISFPQFKNPISPYHVANAMALLTQVFSKDWKFRGFKTGRAL